MLTSIARAQSVGALHRLPLAATRPLSTTLSSANTVLEQASAARFAKAGGSSIISSSSAAPRYITADVTRRAFHVSAPAQSTVVLAAGLGLAATALVARFAVQAIEKYSRSSGPAEGEAGQSADSSDKAASDSGSSSSSSSSSSSGSTASDSGSRAGAEAEAGAAGGEQPASAAGGGGWFGARNMAKRFYRGPFEDKMTRREAALILGLRESATPERVRERHRKMLMANHPDMGGSTYLAGKINEAKDMLLKGDSGRGAL